MSGVGSVGGGGAAAADLMKILETSQEANLDLAKKIIKVANTAQVSESEATGLGMAIDLFA